MTTSNAAIPQRSYTPFTSFPYIAQPSSQLTFSAPPFHAAMQAPSAEARGRNQYKPHRSPKLDGIPENQMQKLKLGTLVQTDRNRREHAREVQPKSNFTALNEENGANESRSKVKILSPQKKESEQNRQKYYRDNFGAAFSELRAETYSHEEESQQSEHTKPECAQDAARQLRALKRENAALQEAVRRLGQMKVQIVQIVWRPWEI